MKKMRLKSAGLISVASAGFAVAVLVGVAAATTFTLNVDKNATVTDQQGMTTDERTGGRRRAD